MNKQIEEMAQDICEWYRHGICSLDDKECDLQCTKGSIVEKLVNRGYRKASDIEKELADWKAIAEQYQKQFEDCYEEKAKIASEVAKEIFAEIEQAIFAHGTKYAMKRLEELKKKYEVTDDES